MTRTLSRRAFLRGAGACLAIPFLDAMLPRLRSAPAPFNPWRRSAVESVPRMVCFYVPNGVNIFEWVPPDDGPNFTLSPTLQVLKDYRHDLTVLSGLGHPAAQGGHSGADTWLTAADLKARPGSDYTNTVSADQIAAMSHGVWTRFPSLQLGDMNGTGAAGHTHTLSFDVNGTPLPAENQPRRLFERLFVPDTDRDKKAARKRYAERRSILDDVAAEAAALSKKLGRKDRQKLDEYLGSVRETEKQIERLQRWVDIPKAEVKETGLNLNSQPMNAHDRSMWLDVMLELCYLAIVTDTTRVITFQWSREAAGYGGAGENHHELSHHGGDATMLKKLAEIDRFHLSKLARFLGMLKSTEEGEGNVLDRTVVLYGSGMNSGAGGEHSPKNLPLLVAGGRQLGIKLGRHLRHNPEKHPPLANVLLTIVQRMGVHVPKFADATGTLEGLV